MAHHFLPLHTPEALLGRNDSKNPATTCRGITSSGRRCRRALASPKSSSDRKRCDSVSGIDGAAAVIQDIGGLAGANEYCWQHKDQAERTGEESKKINIGQRMRKRNTELFPLQERNSIETLVQRLGIEELPEEQRKKHKNCMDSRSSRGWQTQSSTAQRSSKPYMDHPSKEAKKGKKLSFWERLCCMVDGDDDYVEIVRHKRRVEHQRRPAAEMKAVPPLTPSNRPTLEQAQRLSSVSVPARKTDQDLAARPAHQQRSASNPQTSQLLSLVPQHLSPQTTSALLAELIKPISLSDEEGYIYIFWLTPQSRAAPAEETARLLLSTPAARPHYERRISDVMTQFSFDGSEADTKGKKTIMLKIGRASNVTRRMNEWQRQCGYALNLVRWYPYVSSSGSPAPSPSKSVQALYPDISRLANVRRESDVIKKVPCVKRVERLIHLELQEKQVKRQCEACGAEHKEWFEVQANQAGVKAVDECIRRWVGWAERNSAR